MILRSLIAFLFSSALFAAGSIEEKIAEKRGFTPVEQLCAQVFNHPFCEKQGMARNKCFQAAQIGRFDDIDAINYCGRLLDQYVAPCLEIIRDTIFDPSAIEACRVARGTSNCLVIVKNRSFQRAALQHCLYQDWPEDCFGAIADGVFDLRALKFCGDSKRCLEAVKNHVFQASAFELCTNRFPIAPDDGSRDKGLAQSCFATISGQNYTNAQLAECSAKSDTLLFQCLRLHQGQKDQIALAIEALDGKRTRLLRQNNDPLWAADFMTGLQLASDPQLPLEDRVELADAVSRNYRDYNNDELRKEMTAHIHAAIRGAYVRNELTLLNVLLTYFKLPDGLLLTAMTNADENLEPVSVRVIKAAGEDRQLKGYFELANAIPAERRWPAVLGSIDDEALTQFFFVNAMTTFRDDAFFASVLAQMRQREIRAGGIYDQTFKLDANTVLSSLSTAAYFANPGALTLLIDAGLMSPEEGRRALFWAVSPLSADMSQNQATHDRFDQARADIVQLLCERNDLRAIDVNQRPSFARDSSTARFAGNSALHIATQSGLLRVVQALLRCNADRSVRNANDFLSLDLAQNQCRQDIANALSLKDQTPVEPPKYEEPPPYAAANQSLPTDSAAL